MTGTLNGHPVHSYTWADGLAAIFQGHYMEQYVEHGGCAR